MDSSGSLTRNAPFMVSLCFMLPDVGSRLGVQFEQSDFRALDFAALCLGQRKRIGFSSWEHLSKPLENLL